MPSADRAITVLGLADEALALLVRVAAGTGHVPAAWLSRRHVGGEDAWCRDLGLDYLREVTKVFTALLRGELLTTAATSPVLPAQTPLTAAAGP